LLAKAHAQAEALKEKVGYLAMKEYGEEKPKPEGEKEIEESKEPEKAKDEEKTKEVGKKDDKAKKKHTDKKSKKEG
jgi:hypothetical protein